MEIDNTSSVQYKDFKQLGRQIINLTFAIKTLESVAQSQEYRYKSFKGINKDTKANRMRQEITDYSDKVEFLLREVNSTLISLKWPIIEINYNQIICKAKESINEINKEQ